ncbi:MAG: hypothetical protein IMZ52_00580 [Actinobacteria bacterium]|nr:hypothetical protein [Bacteroidota bacterium]MBE3093496.1 hypothetical protein [Actinomycetota bacterium]
MSNLYLTAITDTLKKQKTATANKGIAVEMGYNPGNHSKRIFAALTRDGDNIELEVKDSSEILLTCTGTVQDGILECQPYNWAGPYPKLQMKRK